MNGFSEFGGFHPDRSSTVLLLPTEGIVKKIKPQRAGKKMNQEFFALRVWDRLLKHYRETYRGVEILSPRPIAVIRDEKAVLMEYLAGDDFSRIPDDKKLNPEFIAQIARKVGALLEVKERERLEHRDFQPRHLVSTRGDSAVGVIDVENSRLQPELDRVVHENRLLVDRLMASIPDGKIRTIFLDNIKLGRKLIPDQIDTVIGDVLKTIEHETTYRSGKFRIK